MIVSRRQHIASPYLLDNYLGADRAFSFRKLKAAPLYSCKIRRDSDDGTTDILLSESGGLELTSLVSAGGDLTTWIGVNNGYIDTWYDQSENGNDFTQSTLIFQPQIILSGALILINSEAVMQFDGVNDFLTSPIITDNLGWMFTVQDNNTEGLYLGQARNDISTIFFVARGTTSTGNKSMGVVFDSLNSYLGDLNTNNSEILATFSSNGSATLFHANGAVQTTNIVGGSDNGGWMGDIGTVFTVEFTIGAINRSTPFYSNGNIKEVIIYPSDQSGSRIAIETDINDFYSIY